MRTFICDHCGHLVFFDNTECVHCGATLAFVPEHMRMVALQAVPVTHGLWASMAQPILVEPSHHIHYRMCRNRHQTGVACNFTTESDGSQPYCISCRQTRWLPDLSNPINLLRAHKLESAKRYLFYNLSCLQLTNLYGFVAPIFDFLEDIPGHPPVMTGHGNGVITLNVAEADDDERARRRLAMWEPYRTLLGHLRHESGHFFWDALIRNTHWLEPFRTLFGDEREDYAQALQTHYALGPKTTADWQPNHVSAYATAHPWEDWAETWAHYLHLMDLMETAACYHIQLQLPGQAHQPLPIQNPFSAASLSLPQMLQQCIPLTLMLNSLTRSMGQQDAYPFALSVGAINKLQFIHDVITAHRESQVASLG